MPKRLTQEEFELRVLKKLGPDYKVLGQYINKETKIEMMHYTCGNKFMKRPGDVMVKGSGCPFCNGNRNALYNEQWVINNTPQPYHYISGYTKMSEKCLFHCDKCNIDFRQSPSRLINEHIYGCNCCPTKKKTHEEFLQEIQDVLDEYEVKDEYINIDTPITFLHKPCGCSFQLTPYHFIYSSKKKYCPICYYKKSKGEIKISQYLVNNQINFQKEFIFPDLPRYRFDFYLPENNIVIEYDGEQHYTYSSFFFKSKEEFLKRQQADKIKNQYCIDNHIQLFRISYIDFENINSILHNILKEKSSTTIEKYLITE